MSEIKHQISLPLFQPDNILQVVPFYNTWRDGGFRMEEENINEKQVFHNYGQGLAEFSLAYGSAYVIGKMVSIKKKSFRTKSCAVIGSGINALMTTLELLKRGLKVTLYTSKPPVRVEKGKKVIESAEGLQFWYCGDYDNDNPVQHELVSKLSLDFLKECLNTNRYQSLSWSNVYVSGPKVDELRENVTEFLTKEVYNTNLNFGNEKLEEYTYFRTIQIDTELFTEEVFTEIRLRNTNVVIKEFKSLDEILSLQEEMIFNCLGSENKTIFGDKAVSSIPSFYISLKKISLPPKVNFSIWKSSETEEQDGFVISASKKKMQITSRNRFLQPQEIQEEKEKQKLFTKAYHFVKEHTTQPSKL